MFCMKANFVDNPRRHVPSNLLDQKTKNRNSKQFITQWIPFQFSEDVFVNISPRQKFYTIYVLNFQERSNCNFSTISNVLDINFLLFLRKLSYVSRRLDCFSFFFPLTFRGKGGGGKRPGGRI